MKDEVPPHGSLRWSLLIGSVIVGLPVANGHFNATPTECLALSIFIFSLVKVVLRWRRITKIYVNNRFEPKFFLRYFYLSKVC